MCNCIISFNFNVPATMAASESQASNVDNMGISLNPDGSLNRPPLPTTPATPQLISDSQLTLSKDIPLNPTNATFLRLFRPVSPPTGNLPIIIYSHGGGFILESATTTHMHNLCSGLSAHSSSLVISLEYRLAPEHRLPAAYDDGEEAIKWLCDQARLADAGRDQWLTEYADFSKVYLMGSSAGGNLTYTVALRALDLDLHPIKIVGLILDQPFFGGVERTESELRLEHDDILSLASTDLCWSLALPLGSDRDHEFCNPVGERHRFLDEKIKRPDKLPCLMRIMGEDPLVDRQKQFAKLLESHGLHVTIKFYEEGKHTLEIHDPKKAELLYDDVKSFISI